MVFEGLNGNGMMKHRDKFVFLVLFALFSTRSAFSQELGNWSFSQSAGPDGKPIYSASIRATNMISAGSGPDYAPLYRISCKAGDASHWSQGLDLEDSVSGSGDIELSAIVDTKAPREENWQIGPKGRILTRENTPDIAELRRAHSLKLSWSWGWSWLWISDKAKIDLSDIEPVIFTLAKNCGIVEPE
jgi:hypothetical protein